MEERMTWDEIVEKYPDQWVGLSDVEWEDEANVKTAVVKYSDKTSSELLRIQVETRSIYSVYTTPDNIAQLGVIGVFG